MDPDLVLQLLSGVGPSDFEDTIESAKFDNPLQALSNVLQESSLGALGSKPGDVTQYTANMSIRCDLIFYYYYFHFFILYSYSRDWSLLYNDLPSLCIFTYSGIAQSCT